MNIYTYICKCISLHTCFLAMPLFSPDVWAAPTSWALRGAAAPWSIGSCWWDHDYWYTCIVDQQNLEKKEKTYPIGSKQYYYS